MDNFRDQDIEAGERQQVVEAARTNDQEQAQATVEGFAAQSGPLLHQELPNTDRDPIDLEVQHKIQHIQRHFLEGKCPACGSAIITEDPRAIDAYEKGQTAKSHCTCGQRFTVSGRSKLVTPQGAGKIVVLGKPNNRHARRAALKLVK